MFNSFNSFFNCLFNSFFNCLINNFCLTQVAGLSWMQSRRPHHSPSICMRLSPHDAWGPRSLESGTISLLYSFLRLPKSPAPAAFTWASALGGLPPRMWQQQQQPKAQSVEFFFSDILYFNFKKLKSSGKSEKRLFLII